LRENEFVQGFTCARDVEEIAGSQKRENIHDQFKGQIQKRSRLDVRLLLLFASSPLPFGAFGMERYGNSVVYEGLF
jgi:hypothetical protein